VALTEMVAGNKNILFIIKSYSTCCRCR